MQSTQAAARTVGSSEAARPRLAVELVERSQPSLTRETDGLRRNRLFAAAVCLAAIYGVLCIWVFASDNPGTLSAEGSRFSLRVGLLGLRCLLASVVAVLLAGGVLLSHTQLRVVEYVLFGGLTALCMTSQYFVGLGLMHRGPELRRSFWRSSRTVSSRCLP